MKADRSPSHSSGSQLSGAYYQQSGRRLGRAMASWIVRSMAVGVHAAPRAGGSTSGHHMRCSQSGLTSDVSDMVATLAERAGPEAAAEEPYVASETASDFAVMVVVVDRC